MHCHASRSTDTRCHVRAKGRRSRTHCRHADTDACRSAYAADKRALSLFVSGAGGPSFLSAGVQRRTRMTSTHTWREEPHPDVPQPSAEKKSFFPSAADAPCISLPQTTLGMIDLFLFLLFLLLSLFCFPPLAASPSCPRRRK